MNEKLIAIEFFSSTDTKQPMLSSAQETLIDLWKEECGDTPHRFLPISERMCKHGGIENRLIITTQE